ncbi:hypothetical protein ACPV4E_17795, partial [Vibrio alfacsensis]
MLNRLLVSTTILFFLSACGGGGGSDGSDGSSGNTLRVYSTTPSVYVTGNSMDYTYATVAIDSTGVVEEGSSVYIGVLEDTAGLLNAAEMHFITEQSGDYILEFKPGYLLQDGKNESLVSLAFCYLITTNSQPYEMVYIYRDELGGGLCQRIKFNFKKV